MGARSLLSCRGKGPICLLSCASAGTLRPGHSASGLHQPLLAPPLLPSSVRAPGDPGPRRALSLGGHLLWVGFTARKSVGEVWSWPRDTRVQAPSQPATPLALKPHVAL